VNIKNEIASEISDILKQMFPMQDQRMGGPDSTWMRVHRLMLLSGKMAMAVNAEFVADEMKHIDAAVERNKNAEVTP